MSTYAIDFSDPLKGGFSIPAGGFNGPGGSSANTSLRLYGRGALEWGEAVDEDLVRLTENFASASAPSFPIAGQLWIEQTLYYRNTSLGNVLQGWYYYDINETAPNKWKLVLGTGVVPGVAPGSPTEGQYYHDGSVLRGFYSLGRYEPSSWVARSHITGAGAPVSPGVIPLQILHMYDGATSSWSIPGNGVYLPLTGGTLSGVLALGGNKITGLADGTNAQDAVTFSQMNTAIGVGVGGGAFLATTGGTMTGAIAMSNNKITGLGTPTTGTDAATKAYVDTQVSSGTAPYLLKAGGTMTGTLTLSGATIAMGSNKITGLANGTNAQDAVTLSQMNSAIAAGGAGNVAIIWSSGTYVAGGIAISAGKIYIAIGSGTGGPPGGNWKQVFPAVYA